MHFLTSSFLLFVIGTTFAASPNSLISLRSNRLLKRPPFQCPEESLGKYPFPGDCRSYYLCWLWSPSQSRPLHTIRTCPQDMLFDVRRQTCVYHKVAVCHEEEANFICPVESAVLRNRQCDRFWLCYRWSPYLKYCPYGYKFDVVAKRCLPWMEAQCEEGGAEDSVVGVLPSTMLPGLSPQWGNNQSTSTATRGGFSGKPVWMTSSTRHTSSSSSSNRRTTFANRTSTSTTASPSTTTSTTTTTVTPNTTTSSSSTTASSSTTNWVSNSSSTVPSSTTMSPVPSSSNKPFNSSSSHWYQTTIAQLYPSSSSQPSQWHSSTVFYPKPEASESLVNSSTTKTPSLVCKYIYL